MVARIEALAPPVAGGAAHASESFLWMPRTMGILEVFANASLLAKAEASEWGVLPLIALIAALVVAIVLTYRVVRDLKGEGPLTDADDLLNPLLQAYAAGEINREEFLRARDALARAGYADKNFQRPLVDPPAAPNRRASTSKRRRTPVLPRRDRFRRSDVAVRQRRRG